jgi:hypothetical protein
MFKTKNDQTDQGRARAVKRLNTRLAGLRPATPGGLAPPPGDTQMP